MKGSTTMSNRKSDTQPRNHFRSGRFFNAEGQWHFTTREQTIEGPFASKQKASDGLARYVKAINCIMLEASGRDSVWQLSMEH
jgi:hypothetical protein